MKTGVITREVKRVWLDSYLDLALWSLPELGKAAGIPTHIKWREDAYTPHITTVNKVVSALNARYGEMGIRVVISPEDILEKPTADPRAEEMIELEKKGMSRQEIGNHFDVSRERVRQILGNFNPKGMRQCKCCGGSFLPERPSSKYCSPKCKYDMKYWGRPAPTYRERNISKMTKNLAPPDQNECWIWKGHINTSTGYGKAYFSGKYYGVHRYMWQLVYGNIPEGMFVCHTCDTPACCNPSHLYLGTAATNARDRDERGRHQVNVLSNEQVAAIRTFYKSTSDLPWLARTFKVHPTTVYRIAKSKAHAGKNKNSKLSTEQVLKIRELHSSGGHTCESLAAIYPVKTQAIRNIIDRKSWKRVV